MLGNEKHRLESLGTNTMNVLYFMLSKLLRMSGIIFLRYNKIKNNFEKGTLRSSQ